MPALREAFDKPGKTVDLGNKTWQHKANDTLRLRGRRVTGDGAKILVPTGRDREACVFVMRGEGTRFDGDVTMIGQMPDGHPYFEKREAQHFIIQEGLVGGGVSGWKFRNGWGDAIHQNRNRDGQWCEDVVNSDLEFDEMGRHHVTVVGSDNCILTRTKMGRCGRSFVDCEPGGKGDGARNFVWSDTVVTGTNNFPVFANGGVGTAKTVHHITLDGIHCTNRPFSVTVNPDPEDPDLYRSEYVVAHCSGKGPKGVNRPQLIFRKIHGVYLLDIDQPTMPGVPLAKFDRCDRVRNFA